MLRKLRNFLAVAIIAATPALTVLAPSVAHAAVDTCTWTGAGDGTTFGDGTNWSVCDNSGVPENGDSLIFPLTATTLTPDNDLPGMSFANITFSGTGSMGYTVTGNAFTLTGNITDTSDKDNSIDNGVAITGTTTVTTPNMLTFTGNISGAGSLIKAGAGRADFTGVTFGLTGAVTVNAGRLQLSADSSADATFSGVTVASGATFGYDAFQYSSVHTYTFSKPITSAGTLEFTTNDTSVNVLNLTSAITLTGDTALIAGDGTTVHIQGALTGTGFKITAPGQGVVLNESTSNSTATPAGNLNPAAVTPTTAPAAPDTGFALVSAHPGMTLAATLAATAAILAIARMSKTSSVRR